MRCQSSIRKVRKSNIPKAIREQVWLRSFGKVYEDPCYVHWCENIINVFDFHVGHDIPESKGGTLDINNLKTICARCNLSMANTYTIKEWQDLSSLELKDNMSNKPHKLRKKNFIHYF